MKRKMTPYQFLNEKRDGKQIITLSGVIRKRYWDGDKCIDAKLLRDTLDGVTDEVVIKLNSSGGDVFEGVEIYNYIKDHPSHITVEVTGQAASAATFILAGADTAVMNVGTVMMIHEASVMCWGNKGDLKKTMEAMETIDQSIINIYTDRTGQTEEQITQWMEDEKYFTADEAVKYGFADEVKKNADPTNEGRADITDMVRANDYNKIEKNIIEGLIQGIQNKNEELYQTVEEIAQRTVVAVQEMEQFRNQLKTYQEPEKKQKKSLINKLRKGE